VLPLPAPGYRDLEESIPSGEKPAVDWTLCKGHGLCADIVPELIRLGPDGYPTLADAAVPMHLRGAHSVPCAGVLRWHSASNSRPPSDPHCRRASAGRSRQWP
jgi:hypothetical protein